MPGLLNVRDVISSVPPAPLITKVPNTSKSALPKKALYLDSTGIYTSNAVVLVARPVATVISPSPWFAPIS